ncbi:hypothetical protein ACFKHW_17325 [Bradyrhizobium lupini]|uniref:hypothetical protein n=1 Tax=Rhizobium lupini TaxID=136996 RepID=UPI00366F7B17
MGASATALSVSSYLGISNDVTNWIEVWLNGTRITQAGNWTITSPTGSLATIPRPITDAVLTFTATQTGTVQIVGARRPRRTSQFSENRGVAARDLNQVLSDITAQNRETWDKINDVTGRAIVAPPGETLAVLASAASRASSGACFDASGNLVSCVSIPSTTFTAGNGITITGTSPKTITSNIQGSGPITITGTNPLIVGCATCNISSRATALTLDLSAYSVMQTLGYATGGDGGGATFKKVAAGTPFTDQYIATGAIMAAGSGYANGTYFGVLFSGGTGTNAAATVTVAGGAVTTVTVTYPGSSYSVGDVLTIPSSLIGGSGSGFTWTVSAITSPTGSFIDSVGTRFQIVMPDIGIDARAFGVKFDWNSSGGDAAATDNFTTLTNVYLFAGASKGGSGIFATGGTTGGRVLLTNGTAMYCGSNGAKTLAQPYGVNVKGQGDNATALKPCNAWAASSNMYELCNSQSHQTCFNTMLEDMQIFVSPLQDTGTNANGFAVVYTNNCQQEGCGLRNVAIFTGACRIGYKLEIGYGGASYIPAARDVQIVGGQKASNCAGNTAAALSITNFGTTSIVLDGLTIGGLSAGFGGFRDSGLVVGSGFVEIRQYTAEQVVSPLIVNITGGLGAGMVTLKNFFGDPGCVWFATLASTNTPGNFSVEGPMAINSCTSGIVLDAQPGGTNMTSPQVLSKAFNP